MPCRALIEQLAPSAASSGLRPDRVPSNARAATKLLRLAPLLAGTWFRTPALPVERPALVPVPRRRRQPLPQHHRLLRVLAIRSGQPPLLPPLRLMPRPPPEPVAQAQALHRSFGLRSRCCPQQPRPQLAPLLPPLAPWRSRSRLCPAPPPLSLTLLAMRAWCQRQSAASPPLTLGSSPPLMQLWPLILHLWLAAVVERPWVLPSRLAVRAASGVSRLANR